jgi:hypothetical protein
MTSMQPDGGRGLLAAVLCAMTLSAVLVPASPAASPNRANLPGGCGPTPSWISSASLPEERQDPLPSCFSGKSSQAEAVLSILNNRPYAQLLTVSGAQLDLAESSFAGSLEGALARLLARSGLGTGPSPFLLGPGQRATLVIDRPAPGQAQTVLIAPVREDAFAVAALAWGLLSAAAGDRSLSTATRTCVASAVYGAVSTPHHPMRALERMHVCVNAASVPALAMRRLRRLAARLLRDHLFEEFVDLRVGEPHPVRIAFTISGSNPDLINSDIHLGPASFETLPNRHRTIEHLSATGGVPPYRFYIVPEPGGPGVPSWLHLASDGTLTVEPPVGFAAVTLPVEVVDSHGEHSVLA